MKRLCFLVIIILITPALFAQITKSLPLISPGTLSSLLTEAELSEVTDLTISGNIDARDFKTMRDLMPVLAGIDLNDVTVAAYSGVEGTSKSGNLNYLANTVPESAFQGKSSLSKIVLPVAVYEISAKAFLSCSRLQTVTLPSSLQAINDQTFGWCYNLSSIALPESLNYIGYQAFATTNLSVIDIPKAVDFIGDVVFFQCRKLQEINVSALNTKYSSVDGVLFNKNQTLLIAYPGGKTAHDYNIPSGVTKISVRSFEGSKLTKINIPEGVLQIGFEAFTNMSSLLEINIPSSIVTIEGGAFAYNKNLMSVSANRIIPLPLNGYGVFDGINKSTCLLYVPAGSANLYRNAVEWKDFQNIVSITAEVEMTYIPDDNFEQALINLKYDVGPLDDSIPTNIARSLTTLNISNKGISDLTGIEAFSNLQTLQCYSNKLNQLNVSGNLSLLNLVCDDNLLTNIDVTKNSELISLSFSRNYSMTSIDVSKNEKLNTLWCDNSKIAFLNLANNPLLVTLYCNKTLLSSLDISKNLKLFEFNATGNPNLFCIQVYDKAIAETKKSWQKDSQASYSTDCVSLMSQKTYIPDDNFEQALIDLGFDSGSLNDSVQTTKIIIVKSLSLQNKNIADLTGIEDFTSLETLYLSGNKLASLDLSQNTKLKVLHCQNNRLTSLDVSKNKSLTELAPNFNLLTKLDLSNNPALIKVFCQSNQLTELDIRNNKSLLTLICSSNQLTNLNVSDNNTLAFLACDNNKIESLDLSNNKSLVNLLCNKNNLYKLNIQNGNNANMIGSGKGINASDNSALLCIQVDDPSLAVYYTNWQKDPQTSYSTFCNNAPTANAGANHTADVNTLVMLNGSGSVDFEGDSISYQWHAPEQIILSSSTAVKPTFIAPNVLKDTTFLFTLTVSDKYKTSSIDSVYITIKQINKAPIANAGSNIRINELSSAVISGSRSTDPENSNLSFRWIVPNNFVTESLNLEELIITAPEVQNDITFMIELIVNDGILDSEPDRISITIVNMNKAPVAIAGSNKVADENTEITIDGSESFDFEGDQLMYQWISPDNVVLNSSNISKPSFTAPEVFADTVLFFVLTVSDGIDISNPDTLYVNVKQVNKTPVANAGVDQSAKENTVVVLDGTGSYDFDNDALQFNWVAPDDIQLNFENPKAPTFTVPIVSKDTTFLFTLMVSDGISISMADSVFVFVKNVNRSPVANAGSNQVVAGNSVVHIDGSQSNDPDGDNISYLWTAPSGIELSSYNSSSISVTMPEVESPTDFVFGLMVTDGVLFSEKVEIIITVLPQTAEVHLSASLNNAAIPASLVKYDFYIEEGGIYEWQEISPIKEGNNSKFGLTKGNWIIMASPVSNDFPFIPTYFGDKLNWKDAQLIEISDYSMFSGIINCQPADTVEAGGEFTIKGYITQTSGNKSGVYYNGKIEGSPLEGIIVYLYQEAKQVPVTFDITDEDGYYTFSNIPGGNYFISVELPGFEPENEFKISLENSSPLVSEMNFNVIKGTGVITGIEEFESKIHFYPNPFDNEIKIVSLTEVAKVIIFNSMGQTIKTISNPNSIIQAGFLKPGIYFISVFDTDNRLLETGKLIKNR